MQVNVEKRTHAHFNNEPRRTDNGLKKVTTLEKKGNKSDKSNHKNYLPTISTTYTVILQK